MNMNKHRRLLLFAVPLLIVMFGAAFGWDLLKQSDIEHSEGLSISLDSGFYTENQVIEVNVPKGMTVFYTSNCGEPSKDNGQEYTEPIEIVASNEEVVYVYRFKGIDEAGNESEVITKTYFVGTAINTRYTTNVLSVVGDPEELFGYEEGIFARGKLFDDFMAANPDAEYIDGVDANFMLRGREYERAVYIEYFSDAGENLFAVNGGVRVHGAMSRMKNQKSLRLYARKEYDENNEFRYPVLSGLVSDADGTVAQKHKRLVVRNSGNDNGFAFIRSELVAELADEAGFPDVMHAEPVCVYINGIYQGVYWICNTFDAQYFENRYGGYTGEFVVLEGGDISKVDDEDPAVQIYVEEYNQLYEKFASMDLTIEENYQELQKVLDVENYLQYFAILNFVGNKDWPHNNLKVYRYVSENGSYVEGSVFDGRYRHLLFDVDYGFGLKVVNGIWGISPEENTLETLLNGASPLFSGLMEREDCRHYFVNYTCDLMNDTFSPQNVSEVLEEMHESRYDELYHMLQETDMMKDSLWNWETDVSIYYDTVEKSYNDILNFAKIRPQQFLMHVINCFGYNAAEAYTLHVRGNGMSGVQVNSISITDEEFTGVYFGNVPISISPNLVKNEVFDYWLVNGEVREEEVLLLTTEDIVDYQMHVELVTQVVEEPVLQIQAVRAKGKSDYIELINLSDKVISTANYFLSDSDDLYKYALPDMVVKPGETIRFYGKDCIDLESMGQYGLNFNLKQGEIVTLRFEKETLETLLIPDLSENGVYERDAGSGKFVEIL